MALTEIKTSGIADDAVTTDKLANAINTERTANTAKPSLANDGNNRVVTGDGSGGLNGEANLTFDGSTLLLNAAAVTNTNDALTIKKAAGSFSEMSMTLDASTAVGSYCNAFVFTKSKGTYWNGYGFQTTHGHIGGIVGKRDSAGGDSDQEIRIEIGGTGINASQEKTWNFQNNGNFTISDGSLVLGTAGHGIDFSATSDATGKTSELLDDYEEGTWTPTLSNGPTISSESGRYIKIGKVVHVFWAFTAASDGPSGHCNMNMPFTMTSTAPACGGTAWDYRTKEIFAHVSSGTAKLYFYDVDASWLAGSSALIEGEVFRGCTTYEVA